MTVEQTTAVFRDQVMPTLSSLNLVFFMVSMFFVWKERKSPIIANRNIYSVFLHTMALTMAAFFNSIAYASGMPCGSALILNSIFVFLNSFLLERLVLLILKFQLGVHAAQMAKEKLVSSSDLAADIKASRQNNFDLFAIHAASIGSRKIPISKIVATALYLIWMISAIAKAFALSSPADLMSKSGSQACISGVENSPSAMSFWQVYLGHFIILIAICMWKLRKVQENYFIKRELKEFGIAVLIGYVINFGEGTIIPGYISKLILNFLVPVATNYVCLLSIARKAHLDRKLWTQKSRISEMSSGNGASSREEVMKRSSEQHLIAIIQNDQSYAVFEKFMIQEFAVENLLFIRSVFKFERKALQGASQESLVELAIKIYKDFIDSESKLAVNIASPSRKNLSVLFASELKEVQVTVFDEAKNEILFLIRTDSLRRFIHSDLYKQVETIEKDLML